MRYVQAKGAKFIRHVSDREPTVFGENHNIRASRLTPEEAETFGVFKLKLVTPPPHNTLTQTRIDGPALLIGGVWTQNWVIANLPAAEAATILVAAKAAAILQIDTETDSFIRTAIGERVSEYEMAEKEATAYKAAGYPVTVPSSVSAWATAKDWTAKAAADSIIATATNWRSAQSTLRAERLLRKEQARTAVDAAELDAVRAQWAAFLAALTAQMTEA
jgi:hypothetical protein